MRRAWILMVAPALVLGLAGAACGDKASAQTIVRSAATKTEDAKTAHLAMTVTTNAGGTPVNVTADGSIDLPGRKGELTMDLGQALVGKVHVLMIGTSVFLQLPGALATQIPGGKQFLKVDVSQLGQQQGINLGALQQNPDATSQLDYLRGVSDDVHEVGKETVRGASTTHYRATVDLKKAAAASNSDAKAAIEQAEKVLGTVTFPIDVWIDGQGRLRKLTYSLDVSKAAGAKASGNVSLTLELFDFGVPVNVSAPPADQTADLS